MLLSQSKTHALIKSFPFIAVDLIHSNVSIVKIVYTGFISFHPYGLHSLYSFGLSSTFPDFDSSEIAYNKQYVCVCIGGVRVRAHFDVFIHSQKRKGGRVKREQRTNTIDVSPSLSHVALT